MQLRRILAGTDFSESSLAAARWAATHLAPEAELILAHAVDIPRPPAFLRRVPATHEAVTAEALADAEQRLAETAAGFTFPRVIADARVGAGPDVLAHIAREREADLIIVGDHGAGHRGRMLLGTTAERLLACAPVPVLIARDLPAAAPASVLAALDGSSSDARVLGWSRLFHERFGARVSGCHAVDVLDLYRRVRTVSAAVRMRELETQFREDALSWVRDRLEEAALPATDESIQIQLGEPRSAIPSMADRAAADLIIMGGRGGGAVSRAVLGSVTSSILNTTTYAVLVVVGADSG